MSAPRGGSRRFEDAFGEALALTKRAVARRVVRVGVTLSPVIWNPASGWPFRTRVRRLTKARRRAVVAAVTRKVGA